MFFKKYRENKKYEALISEGNSLRENGNLDGAIKKYEEAFQYKIMSFDYIALMKKIASTDAPFIRKEVSKKEALELFKNDKYKTELINDLEDGAVITTYQDGDYIDLCRGPHVSSTKYLKNFKLLAVSGAYWRDCY